MDDIKGDDRDRNLSIIEEHLHRFTQNVWSPSEHGKLVLSTITGSRLYGTFDVETSDVDVVSVYICPLRYMIGLDDVKRKHCISTLTNNKSTPKGRYVVVVDCIYH